MQVGQHCKRAIYESSYMRMFNPFFMVEMNGKSECLVYYMQEPRVND